MDVSALLPRVGAPTLVLHSRRDAAVPFDAGRELAAGIPGAKLVVLDKGKIAEIGTHQELLDKEDGVYARLVRIQSEMHRSVAV